jgi:thiosulfate/3-mercaptopyruvate sulfurtransferase
MIEINLNHKEESGSSPRSMHGCPKLLCLLGILLLALAAISPVVDAGCSCGIGNWDPYAFLNSELESGQPVQLGSTQGSSNAGSPAPVTPKPEDRVDAFPGGESLKTIKSVSASDLVVDVSNGESYANSHIKNAIHLPAKSFLNTDGTLKSDQELVKTLGSAGISKDDSIVLYGLSQSSGEAELAFWILSYLGHKDVMLLDGSLEDWKAAGLPVDSRENRKEAVEYRPDPRPELLAQYEYVKSGQAQIVDARPFVEFGKGRISASAPLDPDNIIKGDKIKDADSLNVVFERLSKDKPIVVYSDDYSRSSLVWYALELMGYQASIYTWEDWKAHEIKDVKGETVLAAGKAASSDKYMKLGNS